MRELTPAEGWARFDHRARYYLHISGAEFLARYQRGEYAHDERREVVRVVAALPLVWHLLESTPLPGDA